MCIALLQSSHLEFNRNNTALIFSNMLVSEQFGPLEKKNRSDITARLTEKCMPAAIFKIVFVRPRLIHVYSLSFPREKTEIEKRRFYALRIQKKYDKAKLLDTRPSSGKTFG